MLISKLSYLRIFLLGVASAVAYQLIRLAAHQWPAIKQALIRIFS